MKVAFPVNLLDFSFKIGNHKTEMQQKLYFRNTTPCLGCGFSTCQQFYSVELHKGM